MKRSIMQTELACYLTGSQTMLELHHCFHGPRRKAADEWGCWIWLRQDLHRRLHDQDKELDRRIERECQERFEELYGHEKFMEIFGKSYL